MSRIMIVDDDATIQMELEEYLSHMGHTIVAIADTGVEAVETAEQTKPDLILMDINMPGEIDGISAAEKIKETMETAVVFVTGFGDPEYIERAKRVEPFGYVMKPFDEKEITAIIEIVLHRRKLELKLSAAYKRLEQANLRLQREINEHKETEIALRESEERYRSLFVSTNDGVCLHEIVYENEESVDYIILECNPQYESITGINGSDAIGTLASQLYGTGEAPYLEDYTEVVKTGKPASFEIYFAPMDKHFLISAFSPGRHQFATVFKDITERKRMEETRKQTLSQFQAALEATIDGIIVVSLDSRIRVVSSRFKKFWRVPDSILNSKDADQALRYVLHQLINPELFFKRVRAAFAEPDLNTFDTLHLKDGRIFQAYSRPQKLADKIIGRVWAFRDVTERKRLQEQLAQARKMETISTFTGGIAHDYNNLVSIIMGNLSMAMLETSPGPDLTNFLNQADIASGKVRDLTHELMVLSRGDDPVKVMGSLKNLLEIAVYAIPADSGISLEESVAQNIWPVTHDPHKMGAVLRNVMTNAVEAMSDGGTLTLSAQNFRFENKDPHVALPMKPGDYVHISIQDEGTGIPKEHLAKIFDPYFSTKAMGMQRGTGLGLATTYSTVKKHGGHIAIDSSPGSGTTVIIYLPAEN